MRLCSVDGCNRKHRANGYCDAHLQRFYRSGMPQGSGKAVWGEGLAWIDAHINHEGDECLIWPYGNSGYPNIWINGKVEKVHRYMCLLKHGNPPTPQHEAAHTCGRGKEGCVSPSHLRWATRAENEADKKKHGTQNSGERNGQAKLSDTQVRAIRLDGRPHREIAADYNIARQTVSDIKSGRRWAKAA